MNKAINLFVSFFILMLIFFLFVSESKAQRWCDLCAMDLQKYRLTKYILTLENQERIYTCSIHCAAIVINKNNVKKIEVSDYETGKTIDARNSFYVVKSDIKGVMSKTSKLAFADKSCAEKFIADHGGTLTDFDEALKIANQDMKQDIIMLKNKMANMIRLGQNVAEANGCFTCHGENGRGGIKKTGSDNKYYPAWNTKEFAVKMDTKPKIKNAIINKKHQSLNCKIRKTEKQNGDVAVAPEPERVIKGKELHALTNYIWSLRYKDKK